MGTNAIMVKEQISQFLCTANALLKAWRSKAELTKAEELLVAMTISKLLQGLHDWQRTRSREIDSEEI